MASIFDLKQSASELPSLNQGTAKLIYEQHPPTRDVTGNSFPNGSIHIRWQVAGTRWWIPSRSYIRMRARIRSVKVGGGVAIQPSADSDIAPNMNLMSNLFQSMEFRIADKTVSRVSDYVSQVDSLEKRLTKSKSWLDSVGKELDWLEPRQTLRAAEISIDGLYQDEEKGYNLLGPQQDKVAQGFGAGDTIEIAATGIVTFGAAPVPQLEDLYFTGDKMINRSTVYTVVNVLTAVTMQVTPFPAADQAASNEQWSRLQQTIKSNRVQQGFDFQAGANSNTISVAATGLITFAQNNGAAVPDVRQIYSPGDTIYYLGIRYEVAGSPSELTVQTVQNQLVTVVAAASNVNWFLCKGPENDSFNRNQFEMIWQPPLSIFKVGHAMPAGKYELVLNPQNVNSYQKRAVESILANLSSIQSPTVARDFEFVVDTMYLYLATVEGPRVDNITYYMSLEQTRCQTEQVDPGGGLQQKNFDVSPSTYALTLAFQDTSASSDNTLFSGSKFKIRKKGNFVDGATSLQRLYIQYAGQNKPQPDADPSFICPDPLQVGDCINYLKQRYADSILYSGAYFDCGGSEDFYDWLNRGMYFYFSWPKDGLNESTRVNVNYQLSQNMGNNASVLLFDHHKKMIIITVREGRVVDVLEQDA